MKSPLALSLCIITILTFSCKSKSDKPGALESLSNLKNLAENVVKETKQSSDRWEERKAKGDTIAMGYKELQAYLPEISGYTTPEGPKGSQMNTPGLGTWSQAEQNYVNGDKKIEISMIDYNAAQNTFLGLTAMYGMGMSFEDDDKKQAPIDLGMKDVNAYETIYKKDKRAELVLVVSQRFIINVKTEGENDESFITSVAKSMRLNDLSSK